MEILSNREKICVLAASKHFAPDDYIQFDCRRSIIFQHGELFACLKRLHLFKLQLTKQQNRKKKGTILFVCL